jgi:hypothetical protein
MEAAKPGKLRRSTTAKTGEDTMDYKIQPVCSFGIGNTGLLREFAGDFGLIHRVFTLTTDSS